MAPQSDDKAHGQAVINLRKYAKQKIRGSDTLPRLVALHIRRQESADDIEVQKKSVLWI